MSKSPETVVYLPGRFFLRRRPSRLKKITGWDMSKSDILDRLAANPLKHWQEAIEEIERLRDKNAELLKDSEDIALELVDVMTEIERLRKGLLGKWD
jgi:hypothetical protein